MLLTEKRSASALMYRMMLRFIYTANCSVAGRSTIAVSRPDVFATPLVITVDLPANRSLSEATTTDHRIRTIHHPYGVLLREVALRGVSLHAVSPQKRRVG